MPLSTFRRSQERECACTGSVVRLGFAQSQIIDRERLGRIAIAALRSIANPQMGRSFCGAVHTIRNGAEMYIDAPERAAHGLPHEQFTRQRKAWRCCQHPPGASFPGRDHRPRGWQRKGDPTEEHHCIRPPRCGWSSTYANEPSQGTGLGEGWRRAAGGTRQPPDGGVVARSTRQHRVQPSSVCDPSGRSNSGDACLPCVAIEPEDGAGPSASAVRGFASAEPAKSVSGRSSDTGTGAIAAAQHRQHCQGSAARTVPLRSADRGAA